MVSPPVACVADWLAEQVYVGELRAEFSIFPFWTLKIEGAWDKWIGSTRRGRGGRTLLFSLQFLLLFSAAICSVLASYFLFRPGARLILPPVCIVFDPRLLLFRAWTKQKKITKRPRSVAASNWIMGCSLLSCSILLRHVAIISAALLFCFIFFFCLPRYLL